MRKLLLWGILSISAVHAGTIDFSDLTTSGTEAGSVQSPYLHDGFQLIIDGGIFLFWDTGNPFFLGQTAVFPSDVGQSILLSRADGGAFGLMSIDLAPFVPFVPIPYSVTFSGTRKDGTQITQIIEVNSSDSFTRGVLGNFDGLLTVRWTQDATNFSQATNIVVSAEAAPEPANVVLVNCGLLAMIFLQERRHRRQSLG